MLDFARRGNTLVRIAALVVVCFLALGTVYLVTGPSTDSPPDRNVSAGGNITVTGGAIQTGDGTITIEGSSGSREKPEDEK